MSNFESNVQYIKYLVNKEVATRFFQGKLEHNMDSLRDIAEAIIPGPKATFRCCIYKERHIIEDRVRLVLEPSKDDRIINVLDSACDECPIDRFVVTEACRGCLGHKCKEVCPRNAITIVNHRSYINQELCIECGRCKQVCPFNAISCGACIYQCPFCAIVDKSFVIDVLTLLRDSWNNTSYHVYAVVAPAVSSQFPGVKTGQVFAAIKELGFHDVVEAAIGADMVSLAETKEFAETVGEKGWKTSSCCPAFVDYVSKNYPEYMDHVSTVVSPMVAIARAIREKDKKAKIIFIGPCTAKKVEIRQEDLRDSVDYVLTFEELRAVFDAREMELDTFDEFRAGEPSSFGRIFARTGGVAESVCRVAKLEGVETEIKPIRCNGIEECIKAMKMASFGRLDANFIEGMACRYGCTGGAASISHDMKGIEQINSVGREAVTDNPAEGIRGYNMGNVEMERIYAKEQPEEPAAEKEPEKPKAKTARKKTAKAENKE